MTQEIEPKFDRRDFLKIGATVSAGIFLMPYPAEAAETSSTRVTPPTSALTAAPEQDSEFSAVVPLHAWVVYGELFAQFKAMYPSITISAVIP
jgi:hypothetical protein